MDPKQLLEHIIRPALEILQMVSREAEILLLATAAQESRCGHYIKQVKGPALGIFQMEPATHRDIYENFLQYKPSIERRMDPIRFPYWSKQKQLVVNPLYSAAMARLQYFRDSQPLPEVSKEAMWEYYKRVYNTHLGAAKEHEWDQNWDRFVGGEL